MFGRLHAWVSRSSWLALQGALLLPGCGEASDEGTAMRASFELEENECGNGLLEVDEEVDFDVSVSISDEDDEITWTDDSGDSTTGTTSGDSFLMTESYSSDQGNGCVITVTSRFVGTFEGTSDALSNVEGDLVIEYEAEDAEACDSLIDTSSGFRELPCDVVYSFDLDVDDD